MNVAFLIEPQAYTRFENEDELIAQCKEWGLLSEKAAKAKTFAYKGGGTNAPCEIVGFVDKITAVIAFEDGRTHCVHPAYLKEMQASTFGRRSVLTADEPASAEDDASPAAETAEAPRQEAPPQPETTPAGQAPAPVAA
ncbi:hypothetical protein PV407_27200, partial [Paenibacillus sp. GYB003]